MLSSSSLGSVSAKLHHCNSRRASYLPTLPNPIECQFGPLRAFALNNSDHRSHLVLAKRLHAHLAWRNANAKHPDVHAAQRKERARIRSERQRR